ncbi:MAG: cupin domain-containing protein [Crenarchaeota archaeon]|nr:cupin domain-containing protein [Thermoproteota archaeon]MCR8454548.1 cupin domain-containing protein [Thermoproteota archaeon]MCR8455022.1 cupin domain-containing protein [Thermoproteota archaeon]MCR8463256.1 cupin domain-containing protein [Thermoproteota archaeon]MCR8470470.1 cupin domain-containing protein [Thermoproteota archaeon]
MSAFIIDTSSIEFRKVEMEGAEQAWMAWLISEDKAPVSFAMRIFKIKPGGRIPLHTHWYYHEIFCIQGEGKLVVGPQEFILKKDMAAFVPPNVPHSYENLGSEDWVFICVIPLKKELEKL